MLNPHIDKRISMKIPSRHLIPSIRALNKIHEHKQFDSFSHNSISSAKPKISDELCTLVSTCVGSLGDLESSLEQVRITLTSPLVRHVLDSCKKDVHPRRLLRFFLWSVRTLSYKLEDCDFNHTIRLFAAKKDLTAMDILIFELAKDGRSMESHTFSELAESLVKLGKERYALRIFNNLDRFKCAHDRTTVLSIVTALCSKGHAKAAEYVIGEHKDKIYGDETSFYRALIYGWSEQKNVKEARRILDEMKHVGMNPGVFSYNTFIRCLCFKNLESNHVGILPEAMDVMAEMRVDGVQPDTFSHNTLLLCLGNARRSDESCETLLLMRQSGCTLDWVSYYLVAKALFLTERFDEGKRIVEDMTWESAAPDPRFYYDLIAVLCGIEKVDVAIDVFNEMKKISVGGSYGPVYDFLIPHLCTRGDFSKGRELWREAMENDISLCCPSEMLGPSTSEVCKPKLKILRN